MYASGDLGSQPRPTATPTGPDFRDLHPPGQLVGVSPDTGRTKLAGHFAQVLGGDLAILNKVRTAEGEANVTSVIGDVQDKVAVMIDDMIDTAGPVVAGAAALREAGAAKVYACATIEGSVRYLVTGSAAVMLQGRQDHGRGPCTGGGASRMSLTS